MSDSSKSARSGDLIQLVGQDHKNFIFRLSPGEQLQSHRGFVNHDDLIGLDWGSKIYSHIGKPFYLLQPSIHDLLLDTRRTTQIMYPKDIGFVLVNMDIGPGKHIIEAGTGSGAFTTALAFAVGPAGHVTTYDIRPEMQDIAKRNLAKIGLEGRVRFKLRNIREGFDESDADGIFLDLPNPEDYISQTKAALKTGGYFGSILPTVNQLTRLIPALKAHDFAFIEVCETFLRYYKTTQQRLRPTDRMVAHTGYLVFARSIIATAINEKRGDEYSETSESEDDMDVD